MSEFVWDYPTPHTLKVEVLPEHIDVMRHTNNVVYLQWLEAVAWSHSASLGLDAAAYEAAGHGMVVRRHELNYERPSHLGDEIMLGTWLLAVDKIATYRAYQFVRVSDGATLFRGRTQFVCVDIAQGRLRRMPAEFYSAYASASLQRDVAGAS